VAKVLVEAAFEERFEPPYSWDGGDEEDCGPEEEEPLVVITGLRGEIR
jgi:hypothetical protein